MTEHNLKVWPPFYDLVLSGEKTFELRKNDRGFQKGDTLILREYDPTASRAHTTHAGTGVYTGRCCHAVISFVLSGWGLQNGYVVLGFKKPLALPNELAGCFDPLSA